MALPHSQDTMAQEAVPAAQVPPADERAQEAVPAAQVLQEVGKVLEASLAALPFQASTQAANGPDLLPWMPPMPPASTAERCPSAPLASLHPLAGHLSFGPGRRSSPRHRQ